MKEKENDLQNVKGKEIEIDLQNEKRKNIKVVEVKAKKEIYEQHCSQYYSTANSVNIYKYYNINKIFL